MPATVYRSSPSLNQTGADSTKIVKTRDKQFWFSDSDIDNYLTKKIIIDGFYNLYPCVVLILASDSGSSLDLSKLAFTSHTIVCPLNIDNLH